MCQYPSDVCYGKITEYEVDIDETTIEPIYADEFEPQTNDTIVKVIKLVEDIEWKPIRDDWKLENEPQWEADMKI